VARYLFVASSIPTGTRVIAASDIFCRLMEQKCWYVSTRTPYYRRFSQGDDLLFYLSGKGARHVLGNAQIAGQLAPVTGDDRRVLSTLAIPWFQFRVPLCLIDVWTKPVPLFDLVPRLAFITDKANWGLSVRQGCRSISTDDYELVMAAHIGRQ
jgi:hypothetical protein